MPSALTIAILGHALSFLSFGALFVLVAVGRRSSPFRDTILIALGGTVLWAGATIAGSVALNGALIFPVLEWLKSIGWIWLTVRLLSAASPERAATYARLAWIGGGIPLVVVLGFGVSSMLGLNPLDFHMTVLVQAMCFMGMIVFGLMLVETLARWMSADGRKAVRYYSVAVGVILAVDLFFFATMLLLGQIDPAVFAIRGLVTTLAPPVLAYALVRQRDWLVDIHVSREVVVNAATLLGGSLYLFAMALAGFAVRELNLSWGPLLHVVFLAGAIILLASILSSEGLRPRLRAWVSHNFFSAKYDYRREWLRFSDALSAGSGRIAVEDRVLGSIMESLSCKSGGLWLALADGSGFALAAASPRSALFHDGSPEGVVSALQTRRRPIALPLVGIKDDQMPFEKVWAAAPLLHHDEMVGIIVLAGPVGQARADSEDLELLQVLCAQASAHVAEERVASELGRVRKFEGTARRLTYVGHDLKNIVSQISLVLQNWTRHSGNPAFIHQLPDTLKAAVLRMKRLLDGLKDDAKGMQEGAETVALGHCISPLQATWRARCPHLVIDVADEDVLVAGNVELLQSVLDQLVTNAMDAGGSEGRVSIATGQANDKVWIEIRNEGAISEREVAASRFGALSSGKANGLGVGLFQVRDYVRQMGGTIAFTTSQGAATTVRMEFPPARERPAAIVTQFPQRNASAADRGSSDRVVQ